MFNTRVCSMFAICAAALCGQSLPDAARLLEGQAAIFQSSSTLQYTQRMDMQMNVMGNPVKTTTTTLMQFAQPDRFRMESDAMTVVFDGQTTWTYMPAQKQFYRQSGAQRAMLIEQFNPILEKSALGPHARVIRSETIEIDGRLHGCWVVEALLEKMDVPGVPGGQIIEAAYTAWIDKQLGLAQRNVTKMKMQGIPGSDTIEVTTTTTLHDVKWNVALPDSLFQFTPPEEAREIPSPVLTSIGTSQSTPRQPRAANPDRPSGIAPEAYVPSLHPTKHVEPEYPDAAKKANKQGDVEMLLIIDPSGSVAESEVLSGEEMFRQPAIDAVKQWRFRPVLREGRAVYAYTSAFLTFYDPGNEIDTSKFAMSSSFDDAGTSRIIELMNRFPRTPQQVLEDLEQDLGPPTSPDRDWILPQLAKAAIAAGSLERASSHANDMLKADRTSPNYGALHHDAHVVRGMVALRQGNVALAAKDLVEAGRTPGSPVLNSFGPLLVLARELLEKGETAAVLEYLSLCKSFWILGADRLNAWSEAIRAGRTPDFGPNGVLQAF